MPKTYIVERVSPEVKEWEGKFGPMVTYRVMFEGLQEPVEMNKKPSSPKPIKGDEVTGTIEDGPFAKKFKAESTFNQTSLGGKKFEPRPDHHEEIKAQWAIGQAVQLYGMQQQKLEDELKAQGKDIEDITFIELQAKELYAMVDRVKRGGVVKEREAKSVKLEYPSLKESWDKTTSLKTTTSDSPSDEPDTVIEDIGDEPINLDDIPF